MNLIGSKPSLLQCSKTGPCADDCAEKMHDEIYMISLLRQTEFSRFILDNVLFAFLLLWLSI